MNKTNISYLNYTWNPVAMRCSKVSDGCRSCWHLRMCDRLAANPEIPENERLACSGKGPFVLRERELEAPLRLKKPSVIGVQFNGDLFHEDVPDRFIENVFMTMWANRRHIFLILTKRSQRMALFLRHYNIRPTLNFWTHPLENVYLGLTICNQAEADEKIPILLQIPGKKFLSIEPMLGPIKLWDHDIDECPTYYDKCNCQEGIDAVILGGETGPGARPMHPDWVRSVRDQCKAAGVPFCFKQWGEWIPTMDFANIYQTERIPGRQTYIMHDGAISNDTYTILDVMRGTTYAVARVGCKKAGRLLDGKEWNDLPWRAEA